MEEVVVVAVAVLPFVVGAVVGVAGGVAAVALCRPIYL